MLNTIAMSVGRGGRNRPIDVIKVQNMLNNNTMYTMIASLPVTGEPDTKTLEAIANFQRNHPGLTSSDGRVDPGGATIQKLRECASNLDAAPTCKNYLAASFSRDTFSTIDAVQFGRLCVLQKLGSSEANISRLMTSINQDPDVTRISWAAYMLATTKHETAHKFEPIAEYGKGKAHAYGKTITVTDPVTKKTYDNAYYGRGFVQLTWEDNYKNLAKALNLTGDNNIHFHADKAMDFDIAYSIMSYGMRKGYFRKTGGTPNTMEKYLNASVPDYFNARDIINGYNKIEKQLDKADVIESYAKQFDFLLRFCNGAREVSPFPTLFTTPRLFQWLDGVK